MMKKTKLFLTSLMVALVAILPMTSLTVSAQDPQTQNQATPMMRGYRTGYSDGYQAAVSDLANRSPREFRNKQDYDRGDRAYNSSYGSFDDYREGYQQGYETGYNAGFDRRPFDSTIPADMKRRSPDQMSTASNPGSNEPTLSSGPPPQSGGPALIPRDTIMRVELLNGVSTDISHKGDPFQARVVEPKEFEGAIIDGQVINAKRPGKVKDKAELQLSFDTIRTVDGRSSKLSAQVIEVISGGEVNKVDSEGGVQGKDSTKSDVKKVGVLTGIGAAIGAIAGGGVGAVVGATIGAGVGTAGVLSQRGQDIKLYQGQQLRIRTNGDAEVQ